MIRMVTLLAAAAAATLNAATDPSPLAPNGPWVIEGSEGACIMQRSFGPDAKTIVGFQPFITVPKMEIMVVTPGALADWDSGPGSVSFDDGELQAAEVASYGLVGSRRLTRFYVPASAMESVKTASVMTLRTRGLSRSFQLVRTRAAVAAYEGCQRLLYQSWQVDPSALTPERAPHMINLPFGSDVYPESAVRQRIQGRVIALLDVDTKGRVAACRIVAHVHQLLDDATCVRARRLRFEPGKDAAGQLALQPYVLPVRWVLP